MAKYEPSIGEIAFGFPGSGEGLEELYDLYKEYVDPAVKSTWRSYDELENPAWSRTKDAAKILPNAVYDFYKFVADVGIDVGQAGIKQLINTELYNPFSKEGMEKEIARKKRSILPNIPGIDFQGPIDMMEKDWLYKIDASPYNPMPNYYEDNPYSNPQIMDKYRNESADRAWGHLLKHEDKGGFMTDEKAEKIWKNVEDEVYWAKYARDNPEGSLKDFQDLQWEKFLEVAGRKHRKDILGYMETDIDRSLMEDYGIGLDKGKSPWREFDMWDYGFDGNPLFKYSTPEAEKNLGIAQIIPELFMGTGLVKTALKAPKYIRGMQSGKKATGTREGIMENLERIEGPGRYKWAEEFLNRRGR